MSHEIVVASELLLCPSENALTAAEILTSEDFFAPRTRLVFDAVTALWTVKPQLTQDDALEIVVRLSKLRYGATRAEGVGCAEWVMEGAALTLYDPMVPDEPRPFADRCRLLRREGGLSRVIHILGSWYASSGGMNAEPSSGGGPMIISGAELAGRVMDELQGER